MFRNKHFKHSSLTISAVAATLMLGAAPSIAQSKMAPDLLRGLGGSVVVMVDAPCELMVNGKHAHTFDKWLVNYPVMLPAGTHSIECVNKKASGFRAKKSVVISDGDTQKIIQLSVKNSGRWKQEGDVLIDAKTQLQWTARDNGVPTSWRTGRQYCARLGHGWRLPTTDELLNLYDKSEVGVPCDSAGDPTPRCKVYEGFRLSSYIFVSSDNDGSSKAWEADLGIGRGDLVPLFLNNQELPPNHYSRALCVRDSGQPQNPSAIKPSGSATLVSASIHLQSMLKGMHVGDEKAVQAAVIAIEQAPQSVQMVDRKAARNANQAGMSAFKVKDYDLAIVKFNEALLADPTEPVIITNRGYALLRTGKLAESKEDFINALSLVPTYAAAWANLALVFVKEGKVDGGRAAYLLAYKFSKDQPKFREGLIHQSQSDPDPRVRELTLQVLRAIGVEN